MMKTKILFITFLATFTSVLAADLSETSNVSKDELPDADTENLRSTENNDSFDENLKKGYYPGQNIGVGGGSSNPAGGVYPPPQVTYPKPSYPGGVTNPSYPGGVANPGYPGGVTNPGGVGSGGSNWNQNQQCVDREWCVTKDVTECSLNDNLWAKCPNKCRTCKCRDLDANCYRYQKDCSVVNIMYLCRRTCNACINSQSQYPIG